MRLSARLLRGLCFTILGSLAGAGSAQAPPPSAPGSPASVWLGVKTDDAGREWIAAWNSALICQTTRRDDNNTPIDVYTLTRTGGNACGGHAFRVARTQPAPGLTDKRYALSPIFLLRGCGGAKPLLELHRQDATGRIGLCAPREFRPAGCPEHLVTYVCTLETLGLID